MSFVWDSPVYFDELDPNGHLHNARFALHVERAQTALFEQRGTPPGHPDLHYVVREFHIEFLASVTGAGPMRVTLTPARIGETSATYEFTCGTGPVYARGHRVIVKLDRDTGRPAPWSDPYRELFG